MQQQEWLAEQFEAARPHLRSVACRMLGSPTEAEDALQEAWLRLSRAGATDVVSLGGWLTTVVARVCLDHLRSRAARREQSLEAAPISAASSPEEGSDPEREALLAESVGIALLVMLDTLTPAERLAFVLHDMFGISFDEIAPIVDRSPTAARQLASRARRRVRGAAQAREGTVAPEHEVVSAFLTAARGGDFPALLAVLDPDAVCRADNVAVAMGTPQELRGAHAVAQQFCGRARAARLARVDGTVAAVWATQGQLRVVFWFFVVGGRVAEITMIADPARLQTLEVTPLEDGH